MITIPPRHYCIIENPVMRDPKEGKVIVDEYGQIRLRHADQVMNLCSYFGRVVLIYM